MNRATYRSSIFRAIAILLLIGITGLLAFGYFAQSTRNHIFNRYEDELARIQNNIRQLDPTDPKYAYQHVQLAQLTGDFADFDKADELLKNFSQDRELALLHAKIKLNMHDVARGEEFLQNLINHFPDARTQELALDIALQKGEYETALQLLRERLQSDAEWPDLARYAYLVHKFGDSIAADELFIAAQEQLSSKQIKDYAWLELQRGIIDLEDEKYPDAQAHFELANQLYPGHWLIEEHLAETYSLLDQPQKAVDLYEDVIKKSNDPMYLLALADLIESQQPDRATQLKQLAEEKFKQRYNYYPLAASGHLIDAWIEQEKIHPNSQRRERLLKLSELNLQHRPNADSQIQRIKVLLLMEQSEEAQQLTEKLLSTPWRTPDVLQLAEHFEMNVPEQWAEFMPEVMMRSDALVVR